MLKKNILVALVGFTLGVAGYHLWITRTEEPFSLPTRTMKGKYWTSLSESQKLLFTFGFHRGFGEGYTEACSNVYEFIGNPSLLDEDNLGHKCMKLRRQWEWHIYHDVSQIDQFYNTYPDKNAQVVYGLILALSKGPIVADLEQGNDKIEP